MLLNWDGGRPLGGFTCGVKPAVSPWLNSSVPSPKFSDLICRFLEQIAIFGELRASIKDLSMFLPHFWGN